MSKTIYRARRQGEVVTTKDLQKALIEFDNIMHNEQAQARSQIEHIGKEYESNPYRIDLRSALARAHERVLESPIIAHYIGYLKEYFKQQLKSSDTTKKIVDLVSIGISYHLEWAQEGENHIVTKAISYVNDKLKETMESIRRRRESRIPVVRSNVKPRGSSRYGVVRRPFLVTGGQKGLSLRAAAERAAAAAEDRYNRGGGADVIPWYT